MAISDKTRKRLWAKSGNRCAVSKVELIYAPTGDKDDSIIGEECHIFGQSPGGPRYDPTLQEDQLDSYDNLILLSRNYHKIVDDNENYYTPDKLRQIKQAHEQWVSKTLDFEIRNVRSKEQPEAPISFLTRLSSGNEVFNVIAGSHAYDFDHDELRDESEVELVASFLQNAQDWGELSQDLESSQRVRAKHQISLELQGLEDNGFWVFGGVMQKRVKLSGEPTLWRIAILRVLRSTSPQIVSVGFDSPKSEKTAEPVAGANG